MYRPLQSELVQNTLQRDLQFRYQEFLDHPWIQLQCAESAEYKP